MRTKFVSETGGQTKASSSNVEVMKNANIVILAVKPHIMPLVCEEIKPYLTKEHLLVSIAAGITIKWLVNTFGNEKRVVRVIPNTPALVGMAASAFVRGGSASADDSRLIHKLLTSVGIAVEVPDNLLDAVTGVSGSGPAYVYEFIESLSDGGVRMGLARDLSLQLAVQTVMGAAQMVHSTGTHPAILREQVTSPGGTTAAGLHALASRSFRGTIIYAVQAATERGRELGNSH